MFENIEDMGDLITSDFCLKKNSLPVSEFNHVVTEEKDTEDLFDNSENIARVLLSLDRSKSKPHSSEVFTSSSRKQTNSDSNQSSKPTHSYIALISMAILSTSERKMLLSEIYKYIMNNFPYYRNKEKSWRNSVRHNLSLNECFIKNGRSYNGKGNYWSIHAACEEDFAKGDFRRRRARRRVRKCHRDEELVAMRTSYGYSGYLSMSAPDPYYSISAPCNAFVPMSYPSPSMLPRGLFNVDSFLQRNDAFPHPLYAPFTTRTASISAPSNTGLTSSQTDLFGSNSQLPSWQDTLSRLPTNVIG
ncbi:forkhead box Q2-like transcription factor [Saccoglossus kowalevskii]|uniref:Forkhead box Q2-like transcription factor n=1 Tax=Saccoglossus kowalevskii TaxID=10224 RepID=D1LX19_SACKO|nr:forkhead box Q2-like transcription factor [Saccoglossus kowalevskii]ACY92525.1 forkhead box Q2-like transcription factor [Saccoglossus kowalevskii]